MQANVPPKRTMGVLSIGESVTFKFIHRETKVGPVPDRSELTTKSLMGMKRSLLKPSNSTTHVVN